MNSNTPKATVFIEKRIKQNEIKIDARIKYEKSPLQSPQYWIKILGVGSTEEEIGNILKEQLQKDRALYNSPNLKYEFNIEIIHIKEETGSPKERKKLQKNIEGLLFD